MIRCRSVLQGSAALCLGLAVSPAGAWSNRGHRMINLVAAESLPRDMPAFMRTPAAIAEIAYLGPEPDRWRPEIEPELSNVAGPDHVFRTELGSLCGPLPRRRTEFISHLETLRQSLPPSEAARMRPERIGTLPWQAEEIFERLQSAFRSYRIAAGDIPQAAWPDEKPITAEDLPSIQASALYYAGWLGHYIGDGSMPLHDTVNIAGWIAADNPNGYTASGAIHHRLEQLADDAIEKGLITDKHILPLVEKPRVVGDPFAETIAYLSGEVRYADEVYKVEKAGALTGTGTPEFDRFIEQRFAEGGAMLRDLIYSAWIGSKEAKAPPLPKTVTLPKPTAESKAPSSASGRKGNGGE